MANYQNIIAAITAVIKQNGNQEITGQLLQQSLVSIIHSLGAQYQFAGFAEPEANPGTPDHNVAYIAGPGTYPNFNAYVVPAGFIAAFLYNGNWDIKFIEIGGGGGGGGTSFIPEPDDLTLSSSILKFANRSYNSQNPNGMGYKILRKNSTFALQVTDANTTYEIRYDFDLNGGTMTVPAGCVLKFVGGKLTNGTLVGQNTAIDADIVQIFGTDITLSGRWNLEKAYPEWFGAKGDDTTNDSAPIQKTLDLGVCILGKKTYKITSPLTFNVPATLRGVGISSAIHAVGCHAINQTTPVVGILISDLSISGDLESNYDGLHFTQSCPKFVIRNIKVSEFGGWGMYLLKSWDYAIDNVNVSYNGNGFYAEEFNSSMLKKIVSFQNNGYGIVIEKSAAAYITGTIQENKLTGLWLGGCFGCSLNIYGEQNGYEGTTNETKSEIVFSNPIGGGETSLNNFLTYYILGGKGSAMQSTYGVYLNWASRNVIMGFPAHHVTKEIYCTGNSLDNIILATSLTGSETNNIGGTNKILSTELAKIPTIESKLLQAKNNSTTAQKNLVITDATQSRSVTFYRSFSVIPEIAITPQSVDGLPRIAVLTSRTTTGFTYKVFDLNGNEDTTLPVNYIAIGITVW